MNKNTTEIDDEFDFGFSTVDPREIPEAKEAQSSAEKLKKMYDLIVPLLDNLSKNPEQEYIRWPDRKKKIEQFKKKLNALLQP